MKTVRRIPFVKYLLIHYDIFVIGIAVWMIINIFLDHLNFWTAIWVSVVYTIAWSLIILLFFYITRIPLKKLF